MKLDRDLVVAALEGAAEGLVIGAFAGLIDDPAVRIGYVLTSIPALMFCNWLFRQREAA